MQIFVKIESGPTFTLEVNSSETARGLGDKIEGKRVGFSRLPGLVAYILYHSIPPDEQRTFIIVPSLLLWQ